MLKGNRVSGLLMTFVQSIAVAVCGEINIALIIIEYVIQGSIRIVLSLMSVIFCVIIIAIWY